MIIIDSNFHEIGEADIDIDCEYGTSEDATNDFQLMNATIQDAKTAGGFYIAGTEIGGLLSIQRKKAKKTRRCFEAIPGAAFYRRTLFCQTSAKTTKS